MIFLPLNKKMVESITKGKKKGQKEGTKKNEKRHYRSPTDSSAQLKGRVSHLKAADEMSHVLGRSVSDSDLRNAQIHAHFYTAAAQRGRRPDTLHAGHTESSAQEIKSNKIPPSSRHLLRARSHTSFVHFKALADALPEVTAKKHGSLDSQIGQKSLTDPNASSPTDEKKPLSLREKFLARKTRLSGDAHKN